MPPPRIDDPGAGGEARRLLRERLQREEMGDEAYERLVSHHDDRRFKIFGLLFIVVLAAIVFGATALGW